MIQSTVSKTITKEGGARISDKQRWHADCPVCGEGFAVKTRFRKHVATHPRCGKCGRRFTSNTSLGIHDLSCGG